MRKVLLLILIAAVSSTVGTQSGVTGRWRAVALLPSGGTAELTFDLKADDKVVTARSRALRSRSARVASRATRSRCAL